MNWTLVAFAVGAYLFGSIPAGLVAGRLLKGVDIRDFGSGKTGTTNTLRTLGRGAAVAVLVFDLLKGVAPVLLAKLVTDDAWVEVAAALAAIAGHDWPLYAGFRGGRGVSTSFGATLAMMPLLGLIMPVVALVILLRWRYVSLMSVLSASITSIVAVALAVTERVPGPYVAFALVAGPLILVLHRENISRLLAGTEPKLGQGGDRRAAARKRYAHLGGRSR